MTTSKAKLKYVNKNFIKGLKTLVNNLPTKEEKDEINDAFKQLMNFLNDLQQRFNCLPTIEDVTEVEKSINKIEDLFIRAESDPIIASVFGIRLPPSKKKKEPILKEDKIKKAKDFIEKCESYSLDKIRDKLHDVDLFTLSEVKAIASQIGMKSHKGLSRESLVHQISMKIANRRGYKHLMNGDGTTDDAI